MTKSYNDFLHSKQILHPDCGLRVDKNSLNKKLFAFQCDVTAWALRRGRAAIFEDCGLGKSWQQIEWARRIVERAKGRVLILAPLAVASQTVREGEKMGIELVYSRVSCNAPITITNYEMLHRFNPDDYVGIVLDESSILKSFEGKFRNLIIDSFRQTPYRLACTATPAPNDYMELGNHAEFLGVLTRTEMLSTFFVHDGGDTSKWRLKGHAEKEFWKWVCSWAVMIRKPSDLGYEDGDFILPPLNIHSRIVEIDHPVGGMLFQMPAVTLEERRDARRDSIDERVADVEKIVASRPSEQWMIWCNLNSESEAAARAISGAVEVTGSDSSEAKENHLTDFALGRIRVLVSKPSICGFGMNFQSCHNVVFLGLSDSYESFYQAVRRFWRFGQKKEVDCYVVTSSVEGEVVKNIQRKEADAERMAEGMIQHMQEINKQNVRGTVRRTEPYVEESAQGASWKMHLGDSVALIENLKTDSIHYSIYSPPFASLYTYSASDRDMGNCRTHSEFYEHLTFLATELLRVTMTGRLMSFHCMNLPTSKERDGVIGITDFRGTLIRIFQEAGFVYHSEVVIWKDPVTAMQRTKALGLLHKQLKKDSCMSRQGIPDYLVTMRKPGDNPERVTHTNESFPVSVWQRYASPVWMDIDPSNTLQRQSAREEKDERHICPLQLEVIKRGLELWTNEGDLVLDPFAGIGSTGYEAVKMGRRFVGIELKRSYWKQAVLNLQAAEKSQAIMFPVEMQAEQLEE